MSWSADTTVRTSDVTYITADGWVGVFINVIASWAFKLVTQTREYVLQASARTFNFKIVTDDRSSVVKVYR